MDIYKGRISPEASDKKVNTIMRVLSLLFIAISVVLAVLNEKFGIAAIAYMMGISWGTLAGCFMGPYVLGVIWKKVTRSAVWASIITSLVATATLILVFGYDKNAWSCSFATALKSGVSTSPLIGVICMVLSLIVTFSVSLITKAPCDEVIYEAFEKSFEGEIK